MVVAGKGVALTIEPVLIYKPELSQPGREFNPAPFAIKTKLRGIQVNHGLELGLPGHRSISVPLRGQKKIA